jgi:hypothetical protein
MAFGQACRGCGLFPKSGGLKGRQLIDNIVDVEAGALWAVQQHAPSEIPVILLWDMLAAFPSIAHEFLWMVLQASEVPIFIIAAIQCLYSFNFHHIVFGGKIHGGFEMEGGIRQGYPLSGLFFAHCLGPLIRIFTSNSPILGCYGRYLMTLQ